MSTTLANVTIRGYGNYATENYGRHALRVDLGAIEVYFSYATPVAFRTAQTGLVVSENCWGSTTGKHINWIDGGEKTARKTRPEFEAMLAAVVPK